MTAVNSLHVLIVEDSLVDRLYLQSFLTQRDCTIVVVEDGQQAVDIIDTDRFDLILMDVQMPVMDGLAATKLIREREALLERRTPIIAVTAGVDRQTCLDAGMDDHLEKPVRADLLDAILAGLRH